MRSLTISIAALCFFAQTAGAAPHVALVPSRPQRPPLPAAACASWTQYVTAPASDVLLCHEGYVSFFNDQARIPDAVVWDDTPAKLNGCVPRSNGFHRDNSEPSSALPSDYDNTGYDRGHNAPDADMDWSVDVEWESFLMTNMTPQTPSLNHTYWKHLEGYARSMAAHQGKVVVINGSIYKPNGKRLNGRVLVPDATFKILIDTKAGTYTSFVMPQAASDNKLQSYFQDVSQIEAETGLKFHLDGLKPDQSVYAYPSFKKACGTQLLMKVQSPYFDW